MCDNTIRIICIIILSVNIFMNFMKYTRTCCLPYSFFFPIW